MYKRQGKDSAKIVSEARAAGFQETILGEGYTDKTYADAGEALKGSWWVNEVSALDPPIRSVLKEYRSLYNENCPPEDVMAAILAYDGVRLSLIHISLSWALGPSSWLSSSACRIYRSPSRR